MSFAVRSALLARALVRSAGGQATRGFAATATRETAATGGGAGIRILGYTINWPTIVATSIAAGLGGYAYATKNLAQVERRPMVAEVHRIPRIPPGSILKDHNGEVIDLKSKLASKYAVLAFGSLHSRPDNVRIEALATAAENAKRKTGIAVVPVFISMEPAHDNASVLKMVSDRAGGGSLALTGAPRELLSSVERFMNEMAAKARESHKGDKTRKKAGEVAGESGFLSDHVYLADPTGQFITMMPGTLNSSELGDILASEVERTRR